MIPLSKEKRNNYMKKFNLVILSIFISLTIAACTQKQVVHHWEYEGEHGPAHWETLKPEFSLCGNGIAQSPINISKSYKTDLDSIEFSYKETPLKIVNNGHTIKVKYKPGSTVTIDGEKYKLLQFHFHNPSEHEVEGKSYDQVAIETDNHYEAVRSFYRNGIERIQIRLGIH